MCPPVKHRQHFHYIRRGVLSTTATLLSLCDISPNRGITLHARGNDVRNYQTIRFYRDKRTLYSPLKNHFEIYMLCSCSAGGHTGPPLLLIRKPKYFANLFKKTLKIPKFVPLLSPKMCYNIIANQYL